MPEFFVYTIVIFSVFGLGFSVGRAVTREPTEKWMFDRLVELRASRKIESMTKSRLEADIDHAASELAH